MDSDSLSVTYVLIEGYGAKRRVFGWAGHGLVLVSKDLSCPEVTRYLHELGDLLYHICEAIILESACARGTQNTSHFSALRMMQSHSS